MRKQNVILAIALQIAALTIAGGQELIESVKQSDLALSRKILDRESNQVNARDINGRTPLHWAARNGQPNLALARLLIERGARLNDGDREGVTALHVAASRAQRELVALLVESGADINIVDSAGKTPLQFAVTRLPLGYATPEARKETVRWLTQAGARVPSRGSELRKMLNIAAFAGYDDLAHRLVMAGADINQSDDFGGSLLHSAAVGGLARLIETLSDSGLDVNKRNRYGLVPIHLAAIMGRGEVIEQLLARGADINVRCPVGKSAFNYAAECGHKEVAAFLKERTADLTEPESLALNGPYLGQRRPGREPEVFAPGIISTMFIEHGPAIFSADGREVYWSPLIARNGKGQIQIMEMVIKGDCWSIPHPISFSGSHIADGFPTLSPDGRRLYFCSGRPDDKPNVRNIWTTAKIESGWEEPRSLAEVVNSGNENTQASVDSTGTIYFGSFRTGGKGSADIYSSRFAGGVYEAPETLGDATNTDGMEYSPYVSPDGRFLLFCADDRADGKGGGDLYVSFRSRDGKWMKAVNLGETINTSSDEYWPAVSPDGKYLFFVSNRNGNHDVYWVDSNIIDELRSRVH